MQLEGQIRPNLDPSLFFLTIKNTQNTNKTNQSTNQPTKEKNSLKIYFLQAKQMSWDKLVDTLATSNLLVSACP